MLPSKTAFTTREREKLLIFFVALEENQPRHRSKHTNQLTADWPPGPGETIPPSPGQVRGRLFAELLRETLIREPALGFKAKQPLLATESFKR